MVSYEGISFSGLLSPQSQWLDLRNPLGPLSSFQGSPAYLNFTTDAFDSFPGFKIKDVRFCRQTALIQPDTSVYPLAKEGRNVGFLLGDNDVVFAKIDPDGLNNASPQGTNITIAL